MCGRSILTAQETESGENVDTSSIMAETVAGRDFYLCLGDFLDEFYRVDGDARRAMVLPSPDYNAAQEHTAYLAATVHKLANDYGMEAPEWVFDQRCFLRGKPFFGCNAKGDLRLLFMYKSPPEFKHRNLFVDENVLKRV